MGLSLGLFLALYCSMLVIGDPCPAQFGSVLGLDMVYSYHMLLHVSTPVCNWIHIAK